MASSIQCSILPSRSPKSSGGATRLARRLRTILPRSVSACKPSSVTTSAISQASEAASTAAETAQSAAQNVVPGSVDAPIWAIVLATLGVTVALGLSTFLFKPGFDASADIQSRDRKSGRFK